MSDIVLEVIAVDLEDAKRAADGGADRLEVCAGMDRDGTTPGIDTVQGICNAGLPLAVMAMVRPRGGDFVYTGDELDTMVASIRDLVSAGVDGVVVGCLTADGVVNKRALVRLTRAAAGASVTFHRALDCAADRNVALDALGHASVDRVLTLGYPVGAPRQATDVDAIRASANHADASLVIMTGGLLEGDAPQRLRDAGIREFHLGRAVRHNESYDHPIDPARVREWRSRLG
jgi:copper homeostasis protein